MGPSFGVLPCLGWAVQVTGEVAEYVKKQLQLQSGAPMTFEDLEGEWLQTARPSSKVDVYKRVMWYHGCRATIEAKKNGWIQELPVIPTLSSPTWTREKHQQIELWMQNAQTSFEGPQS